MSPTAPNRRRVLFIGIVALVVFGLFPAGILIADSDRRWSSWLTPLGFGIVACLVYKFELDKDDDAAYKPAVVNTGWRGAAATER